MNSGKQKMYFGSAAFAAAFLALFGFLSVGGNDSQAQKTLLVICSLLLLLLGGIYVYIIYLSVDKEPNYFLYDKLTGRNIPLSSLTWRMVNDRTAAYIADNIGNEIYLWTSNVLNAENKYGRGGLFRPLAAYKMICDVSLDTEGGYFRLFNDADLTLTASLCRVLEEAGEAEMAKAIRSYKTNGGSSDNFRRYLKRNGRYIQSRMVSYVRRNIERFY